MKREKQRWKGGCWMREEKLKRENNKKEKKVDSLGRQRIILDTAKRVGKFEGTTGRRVVEGTTE